MNSEDAQAFERASVAYDPLDKLHLLRRDIIDLVLRYADGATTRDQIRSTVSTTWLAIREIARKT